MARIAAPAHLTTARKRLYRSIVEDYDLGDNAAALETLRLACEALDRGEQARLMLARDGLTAMTDGGGMKTHPAVAIERDSRLAAVRCLRELSLDDDDGAPSGGYEAARPPRIGTGRLN